MGKGKRVKTERKKRAVSEKLQVPSLQNYPEGVPNYLRRRTTKSGERYTQEWRTLPKNPLDLRLDLVARDRIVVTVNGKFQVLASPFCVEQLSFEKESYAECKLVKGAEKDFAVNDTKTFHIGTAKYYRNIKSENPGQRDPNEGSIVFGSYDIDVRNIEGTSPGFLNANVSINYDRGYIYSCSILEGEEIEAPEYGTYTVFNASPQRIALALGIDVGNHLTRETVKISGLPEVRVFFGEVEYMDHAEQEILYRRAAALNDFREDLSAIFTKTPDYSHQKEFRFFITVDGVQWDFESKHSLVVEMSPNLQFHFGYTYWTDEHEQHRNPKKGASAQ